MCDGKAKIYFEKKRQLQHKEGQHEAFCGESCDAMIETVDLTSRFSNFGPENMISPFLDLPQHFKVRGETRAPGEGLPYFDPPLRDCTQE
jgi:hypothetical protein